MNIPTEDIVVNEASGRRENGRTMAGQSLVALADYCQGFQRATEPWPPLPLADDITISWWRQLIEATPGAVVQGVELLEALQAVLPQLRFGQRRQAASAKQERYAATPGLGRTAIA